MPHYYFDICDGEESAPDEEGMELKSDQAARAEAAKSLADMLRDAVYQSAPANRQELAVVVRTGSGPLMQVKLVFEVGKPNK
jgi:hypothetical protein